MSSQTVPTRPLGKSGTRVPALGFGLMGMSYAYGTPPSDEERFKVLDRAYELGYTFWDSADEYGDSEELLGKWFKRTGLRNKIFLSTKFGIIHGKRADDFAVDSSAEYAKKACEASMKRLGTDYIDLFYLHRANPDTPIEESMRALAQLKAEGKIGHIGLSEITSATLRRACKIAPVDALQMEYSPFVLDIENASGHDVLATCRELGVTLVAFSPLGRGLLTQKFSEGAALSDAADQRDGFFPRFQGENRQKNIEIVRQFKALADKKGCTTSQLALAWLLKQGDTVIPNPGTKSIKYLEENWAVLKLPLTDAEEQEVRKFAESAEVAGPRQPVQFGLVDTKEES